jgi:hypothetical protein
MLLLIVIDTNDLTAETTSMYSGNVLVQEMLITQAQYIEGEFRNMGANTPSGTTNITAAYDTAITFLMGRDTSGTIIDTISYFTGSAAELSNTENDLDRYLYRRFNNTPAKPIGVVTHWHLSYMQANGDVATTLAGIAEIELSMEVQNPFALSRAPKAIQAGERKELYSTSYWQQTRLASKNFRR